MLLQLLLSPPLTQNDNFADEGLWDILIKDIPREATLHTFNMDNLKQGVSYDFRVIGVNDYGYGSPSLPSPSISGELLCIRSCHITEIYPDGFSSHRFQFSLLLFFYIQLKKWHLSTRSGGSWWWWRWWGSSSSCCWSSSSLSGDRARSMPRSPNQVSAHDLPVDARSI